MKKKIQFELCTADIRSVVLAEQHDVEAIELCQDLIHGGITPSYAQIKLARKIFTHELAILIRPRPGHFVYSDLEKKIMLEDIRMAIDLGADTVVVGALTDNNEIDISFVEHIIAHSRGITICFHRAFDVVNEPLQSLQQLMDLQIDRLLTSGQHNTAWEGRDLIKQCVIASKDKIAIMPGAGINSTTAKDLITFTGVSRIHASLKEHTRKEFSKLELGQEELVNENELFKMSSLLKQLNERLTK